MHTHTHIPLWCRMNPSWEPWLFMIWTCICIKIKFQWCTHEGYLLHKFWESLTETFWNSETPHLNNYLRCSFEQNSLYVILSHIICWKYSECIDWLKMRLWLQERKRQMTPWIESCPYNDIPVSNSLKSGMMKAIFYSQSTKWIPWWIASGFCYSLMTLMFSIFYF